MIDKDEMRLAYRTRLLPLLCMCISALLVACSEKSSLTIEEKTRFVAELIAERPECNGFWLRLSTPAQDSQALQTVYEAAKAAHCLKPDV
jgi:hypothetical protein